MRRGAVRRRLSWNGRRSRLTSCGVRSWVLVCRRPRFLHGMTYGEAVQSMELDTVPYRRRASVVEDLLSNDRCR